MNKHSLLIPTKSNGDREIPLLCGMQPPSFFLQVDWYALINFRKPLLELRFRQESDEDWLLYDQIEKLAEDVGVDFDDAAHWVLKCALGPHFEDARQMFARSRPWDPDIFYVCRVVSIQLCKFLGPDDIHTLEHVDDTIDCLLITDAELLAAAPAANSTPC
jgi:hypothetical protein